MILPLVNIIIFFIFLFNTQIIDCGDEWASPPSKKVIILKEPAKKCTPKVIVVPKVKYVKVPGPKKPPKIILVKGPPKKPKIIVVKEPAPPPKQGKTILVKQPPAPPLPPKVIVVQQKVPVPIKKPNSKPQVFVIKGSQDYGWE